MVADVTTWSLIPLLYHPLYTSFEPGTGAAMAQISDVAERITGSWWQSTTYS